MRLACAIVLAFAVQDDYTNTTHVRLYEHVDLLTAKADEHAAAGRWHDVLDIYADAIDAAPDALVPVGASGHRCVSVFDYCMGRLAAFPDAAREAYRLRFDGPVADRLEPARDAAALKKQVPKETRRTTDITGLTWRSPTH